MSALRPVASLTLLLGCCTLVACGGGEKSAPEPEHAAVHWGYGSGDGPARWGSMDEDWILCAEGLEQSPIDLTGASVIELPPSEIELPAGHDFRVLKQTVVVDALDNGHTIQVNAGYAEALTVEGKRFGLVQFHFHAPSEHTIDGRHYPMEIHFVHQADDGALAVVGLLIEEGEHNAGIAPLWEQLSATDADEATFLVPASFADELFPEGQNGVYHYEGSLTTPPCSEGVQWYVREHPTQFSREQIAAFTAVYENNNRPVQPLGSRTLYLDEDPALTIR